MKRLGKKNNHLALGLLFGMFAYWAKYNWHYHNEHNIDLLVMIAFGVLSLHQLFLLSMSYMKKDIDDKVKVKGLKITLGEKNK